MKKITELLEYLQNEHNAEWCDEYGEPGYDQPQAGIVFANWNDIDKDIQTTLEEAGYELEWSDEWVIDYDYGKAWRIYPTSYGWQCSIMITDDGEIITPDDGAEVFIEECAITDHMQPIKPLPNWITLEDLCAAGFERHNAYPYQSGFHPGQTDNPAEIARNLFEDEDVIEVVFQIDENSQFYTCFNVWVKKSD